jgi:hypothetical protein
MPEEPLDRRILREIRERLAELRGAVVEAERLEAALKALETAGADTPAPPRARSSTPESPRKRAPRGANREKALEVIAERPGVTVAELASATGIARNALYGVTRSLADNGVIERVALGGDAFGFRIAGDAEPPAPQTVEPPSEAESPEGDGEPSGASAGEPASGS